MKKKKYNVVLTIAGSDPSGGAGIQADIKTCSALGAYAMSVITAITAQNSRGVIRSDGLSPDMVAAQLDAVLSDVVPDAVKIGMIPDACVAEVIADKLEKYHARNIVIDPVAISTSGHRLSACDTIEVMQSQLFPLATLITPNIPEAESIFPDIKTLFTYNVLLKGGHVIGADTLTDRLYIRGNSEPIPFTHRRINTHNTHGTGCTLSSAIAAYMARGMNLETSVGNAIKWLSDAIAQGVDYTFGSGNGPVNHIHNQIEQWKSK
ncbi:MAG: bifunctional hydroxymethylpyrimidine kinase/phosphomethylpyrimidine kinase [Muribaculaceae bacterium]|nr:bifunctional hydroxymethylpyrimidine kinase/phosphomethylpyrimidine kinase [Muribaculaceae bacterium]